jgi:hypothetical protein
LPHPCRIAPLPCIRRPITAPPGPCDPAQGGAGQ